MNETRFGETSQIFFFHYRQPINKTEVFFFFSVYLFLVCSAETVLADVAQVDAVRDRPPPPGVRRGQRGRLGGRRRRRRQEARLAVQLGGRVVRAPSHRGGPHHAVQHGTGVQPPAAVPQLRHAVSGPRRGRRRSGAVHGSTGW